MQQHIDSYDFAGKKAIVRVDFNVPLDENFNITDDTRIRAALPTLKKVLASGGALIIMSHLGRPKGVNPKFSLKHIIGHVSECLGVPVQFAEDCQAADEQAAALKPGEVLLLENLRFYAEEEGKPRGLAEDATDEEKKAAKAAVKASQKEFVKKLASYADCYINDAFGTAHRAHASTALIADYFPQDKMFGYLMEKEVKAIDNVLRNAEHPFTAIIGGSKVSSKLGVIKNLLSKVDNLIIGGGMGYTFIKAQGGKIGLSLHEDELIPDALEILAEAKEKGVNLSLSVATVAGQEFNNDTPRQVFDIFNIPDDWEGMDAAPESLENWKKIILSSKTILWNGPVGVFELPNFAKGTEAIATYVAEATEAGAYSLVGGGDSVAAVTKMGFADKVSYVSTGGGAMLEAIEGKTLPGVAAIEA
ncbi:MAG: phosphoglycerate kinase [Bacteroidales bacterium]|uniref:phosphoglycerate kinase n=1 Tax=Candidatus Cryptobacteroides sp. TaxID=2952915 RepID=UPI002A714581|nr:phosphoglycerate kinase [Candidatus Cryptobacteroides sp.]MBS7277864.1 phosphoglycerate kinase [Bacteroidales bacterium]MCI6525637.1 phosphoglycerate kinase [Bacteroidales bacterium]MDD5914564.1 phosphoglycerate kinase [Bacteroidales bacterium]MDD6829683.1 phosphoglycerate kinase [Bacteroidales bacterium]MDD7136242.1 phosphoglycerate kinase [Bacteroidales bacterium]